MNLTHVPPTALLTRHPTQTELLSAQEQTELLSGGLILTDVTRLIIILRIIKVVTKLSL